MRDERIRQLLADLAGHLVCPAELAVRASALEDQASLAIPIFDEHDLDNAIEAAAERLALRHGLQLRPPPASTPADTRDSDHHTASDHTSTEPGLPERQRVDARHPQQRG